MMYFWQINPCPEFTLFNLILNMNSMLFAYQMAGLQYRVEGNLEIQRTFFLGIGLITSMDLESPVLTNFILRIKNWKNSFFYSEILRQGTMGGIGQYICFNQSSGPSNAVTCFYGKYVHGRFRTWNSYSLLWYLFSWRYGETFWFITCSKDT